MKLSTTGVCLAPDAPIDLQMHTTYSDGHWALESLFDYLLNEQFGLVAITDHDCVDTAVSVQKFALQKQLPVLVAVEMSTRWQGELTEKCNGFLLPLVKTNMLQCLQLVVHQGVGCVFKV